LARRQADFVAQRLGSLGVHVELVIIRTQGDQTLDRPLNEIGGDGLFTKAIQEELLRGQVDLAVHSLKDLPTLPTAGLRLAAVPPRASTRDVLVSTRHKRFDDLPLGAVVATGSQRRRAMLKHRRPDLQLVPIRGNIDTRLRRMEESGWDGLIMAQAALDRLGLSDRITEALDAAWLVPAVGQGALGLECREDDESTLRIVAELNDPATFAAVTAEREFLASMGGGCSVPIGAVAWVDEGRLYLRGAVLDLEGRQRVDGEISGLMECAAELGRNLAAQLKQRGALELLASGISGGR
jgi:hydroxymethylbilane synthase